MLLEIRRKKKKKKKKTPVLSLSLSAAADGLTGTVLLVQVEEHLEDPPVTPTNHQQHIQTCF